MGKSRLKGRLVYTEREGFEPSIELPLYSISSAAPSTTRPPLQGQNGATRWQYSSMSSSPFVSHPITVHWRQSGRSIRHEVVEGDYILASFERQGDPLPFSCRNGCCTACAVRVLHGEIDQREALGLSHDLRKRGYGLLCVARATGPLEVETQDEDEVYELQFGRHFGRGTVRSALPLEEE